MMNGIGGRVRGVVWLIAGASTTAACAAPRASTPPRAAATVAGAAPAEGDAIVTTISGSANHTCAITDDAAAFCWGENRLGQLGAGIAYPLSATPVAVVGMFSFASISASRNHTCAVTEVGQGYCWGSDSLGELGDSMHASSRAPVAIKGYAEAVHVAAGNNHSCEVLAVGSLYCWGNDGGGALGDGKSEGDNPIPRLLNAPHTYVAITAGNNASCALTTSGTAECWGSNTEGALGRGRAGGVAVTAAPVVGGLAFHAIASGGDHTCALGADGAAWCWGSNRFGALGTGDMTSSAVPVAVTGAVRFVTIAASYYSTCATTETGDAYCWGSIVSSARPVRVGGDLRFASLAVGDAHTCGLTRDGAVYCWGANGVGQLGAGTVGASSTMPVRVHIPAAASLAANVPTVAFIPPFVERQNRATGAPPNAAPCSDTGQAPVENLLGARENRAPGYPYSMRALGYATAGRGVTQFVTPVYPPQLVARRVHGMVLVMFWINPSGCTEPQSFRIVLARDSAMAVSVRDALRRMRFEPLTYNGSPEWQLVEQYVMFSFAYR
jgi:alpha-tubulin suppressor-like RCC1 family protein